MAVGLCGGKSKESRACLTRDVQAKSESNLKFSCFMHKLSIWLLNCVFNKINGVKTKIKLLLCINLLKLIYLIVFPRTQSREFKDI